MRGSNSLLVFILSFVSFVFSGPTHSTRLQKNHISSRQFHYPRALIDVCADVNLSLILKDVPGLNPGSLLGDICLCLSAFPLDFSLYADLESLVNLLGEAEVETRLKSLVEDNGTHCTYLDHASPKCTSGNVCDFTCTDGFVQNGGACLCPWPNSVCNGKCGSYQNGCSSALPRAPKMTRRSITSSNNGGSSHYRGSHGPYHANVNPDANVNLSGLLDGLLGSVGATSGGSLSGRSGIDLNQLVGGLLKSLNSNGSISGGHQSAGLEAELGICLGADISGTRDLFDTISDVVDSFLSSLLGTTVKCKVKSLCSPSVDPNTISIDLQILGLSDLSLGSALDKTLKAVANLLNDLLDVNIVTSCSVDGSGSPATPTLPNARHPLPSP